MPLTELSYAQWAHVEDLLKYRSETVYTKYFVEDIPFEELSESQQNALEELIGDLIGQDNLDIFFDEDDELAYDEVDQVTIDLSVRDFRL